MVVCLHCEHVISEGNETPNPSHCDQCPPYDCEFCGAPAGPGSGHDPMCGGISFEGMPLADIKAIFAADGTFNLGGLGGS